jgi:hypothetical protein
MTIDLGILTAGHPHLSSDKHNRRIARDIEEFRPLEPSQGHAVRRAQRRCVDPDGEVNPLRIIGRQGDSAADSWELRGFARQAEERNTCRDLTLPFIDYIIVPGCGSEQQQGRDNTEKLHGDLFSPCGEQAARAVASGQAKARLHG